MNNAIFLTVRTNSKRLPNKALLQLTNQVSTIEFLIQRFKNYSNQTIILCTSVNKNDDILEEIAKRNNILCFRGSEEDKLSRWYEAAKKYSVKNIATLDGDDIFAEPSLVEKAFEVLNNDKTVDFIKGDHTGLICGLFTYAFTFDSLERVIKLKDSDDTEMMWVYFTETGIFNIKELNNIDKKYYRDDIRMTLDYNEDLDFFNAIIHKSSKKYFYIDDIIEIINNYPEIKNINLFRQNDWKLNQEKNTMLKLKNARKFIGNEQKYVSEILNSAKLSCTSGNWTKTLEQDFAKKFNCKYGIAFNSGTSTMHAALLSLDIQPGDEVISPALTVIMNTSVTIHANAIPVYVDIDPKTFCIDASKIEAKITPKTKAIFIVSIYGLPCDLDTIMKISRKYNIPVIEDNAECFLSTYKGQIVGSITDIASFSFENSKHISCGEGGMITTNNEKYATYCRKMGCHGFKNLRADNGAIKANKDVWQNPDYKRHDEIGWNYRLPEINSAIAYAQLERLETIVEMRIMSANIFIDVIKNCDFLIPQFTPDDRTNSYWALGILYYGEEKFGVSWYDFRQKYIEFGGDGFYGAWSVPYLEPVMTERNFVKRNPEIYKNVFYTKGECPIAEDVQKRLMVFKTNYRNRDLAKYKAYCLKRTIEYYNNIEK